MKASEKAHDTRVFRAARELSARIAALPGPVHDEVVLEVIRTHNCSKRVLADAFHVMDNEPHRFAEHKTWHPRLRRLRNSPTRGEALFKLFGKA